MFSSCASRCPRGAGEFPGTRWVNYLAFFTPRVGELSGRRHDIDCFSALHSPLPQHPIQKLQHPVPIEFVVPVLVSEVS